MEKEKLQCKIAYLEERVDFLEAKNAGLRAMVTYWEKEYKKAKDCLKENRKKQKYRSNGTKEDWDF